MKTCFVFVAAALVVCGMGTKVDIFSQSQEDFVVTKVEINKDSLVVKRKHIRRVDEQIGSGEPGSHPVDNLSRDGVEKLVRKFKLDEKTMQNPALAFGPSQIEYWLMKNLNRSELELEFRARRIALVAADEQHINISSQDMLSHVAKRIIEDIQPKPTPTPKTTPPIPVCDGRKSTELMQQAWEAYNSNNFPKALVCTQIVIDGWSDRADEQQNTRIRNRQCDSVPPKEDKDLYFSSYWALSDVAAALFIRGKVFKEQNRWVEAREAFKTITDRYNCACIWDTDGWFWKPVNDAIFELKRLPQK